MKCLYTQKESIIAFLRLKCALEGNRKTLMEPHFLVTTRDKGQVCKEGLALGGSSLFPFIFLFLL